jgi:hypothetical protein
MSGQALIRVPSRFRSFPKEKLGTERTGAIPRPPFIRCFLGAGKGRDGTGRNGKGRKGYPLGQLIEQEVCR